MVRVLLDFTRSPQLHFLLLPTATEPDHALAWLYWEILCLARRITAAPRDMERFFRWVLMVPALKPCIISPVQSMVLLQMALCSWQAARYMERRFQAAAQGLARCSRLTLTGQA